MAKKATPTAPTTLEPAPAAIAVPTPSENGVTAKTTSTSSSTPSIGTRSPYWVFMKRPSTARKPSSSCAFLPEAARAWVIDSSTGTKREMVKIHPDGFFECVFADRASTFAYRLGLISHESHSWEFEDPYRFGPVLSDFDLHLLGEGTHYKNYRAPRRPPSRA